MPVERKAWKERLEARRMKDEIDRAQREKDAHARKAAGQVFQKDRAFINGHAPHRVHLTVTGNVQGVFFRAYVHKVATFLKLTGWVRNTDTGAVEAVAEGTRPVLEEFLEKCRKGPPLSRVDDVTAEWSRPTGEFDTFDVRV